MPFSAVQVYPFISVRLTLKMVSTDVMLLPFVTLVVSKVPGIVSSGVGSEPRVHLNEGVGIPKMVQVNVAVSV